MSSSGDVVCVDILEHSEMVENHGKVGAEPFDFLVRDREAREPRNVAYFISR